MKKARMILMAITVLSIVGGILAFKVIFTTAYIKKNGTIISITVSEICTNPGLGCLYTSSDGTTFQLYLYNTLGGYYPVKD